MAVAGGRGADGSGIGARRNRRGTGSAGRPTVPERRRPASGAAVVAVAGCVAAGWVALVACAAPTLDAGPLAARLRDDAAAAGLAVTDVRCPGDRRVAGGDRFSCTVVVPNGELRYEVEQTDGAGGYRYELAPGQVVEGADLERRVAADLAAATDVPPVVRCPATVVAPGGRASVDCRLEVGAESSTVTVTVEAGRPARWEVRRSG